ncbi:hypothetical protein LTR36_007383 [Oleoguttula mirabilis]|uniref:DUF7730 domain-containing protein n=1 Tax=Oleoguttula mirabilis TaxID=1507867 RepID=A0AAV9JA33_9PEZI|nr:hypothetical protein LTR36_007383 [Oleoguttula mirabilis]
MSAYDRTESRFRHTVHVKSQDAFTLRPEQLTIAHGALTGRRVLMLEPVTTFFRFMDLPPELRQMVYDLLLTEEDDVGISTYKIESEPRKLCRDSFRTRYRTEKIKWVQLKEVAASDPPSSLSSLLLLSKQVQQEAGTSFYANNTFRFESLTDMKFFLESIKDFRRFLRYIRLCVDGYTSTKARDTFQLLKDATSLRSFVVHHDTLCESRPRGRGYHRTSPEGFAKDCTELFNALHQALTAREDNIKRVTDILQIVEGHQQHRKCRHCEDSTSSHPLTCSQTHRCHINCDEVASHHDNLVADVKRLIMEALGIKE